jgi:hypothetical protein
VRRQPLAAVGAVVSMESDESGSEPEGRQPEGQKEGDVISNMLGWDGERVRSGEDAPP